MAKTKIEWTESSWNPVTGCTKVSEGCTNCYAERFAKRLQAMGKERYKNGFEVSVHENALDTPSQWRHPQMVFVCSMGDLFHESVPVEFIVSVFESMKQATQHTFQILTKRSQRLAELSPLLPWEDNMWAGVTVELESYTRRVDDLRNAGANTKFLSLEPLLGPMNNLELAGIDWVIVGGESGPGARPMNPEWVTTIRDSCLEAKIPFFFKQWGGINKKKSGRLLDGRIWDEQPSRMQLGLSPC